MAIQLLLQQLSSTELITELREDFERKIGHKLLGPLENKDRVILHRIIKYLEGTAGLEDCVLLRDQLGREYPFLLLKGLNTETTLASISDFLWARREEWEYSSFTIYALGKIQGNFLINYTQSGVNVVENAKYETI